MYRRLIKRPIFTIAKRPITKHGTGRVERRARIALYVGIGIGLAAGVFAVMYLASVATIIRDLLPTLILATSIPLIIVTFYIVGILDADADIFKEAEAEVKASIEKAGRVLIGDNGNDNQRE